MLSRTLKKCFFRLSSIVAPSININRYINRQNGWKEDCKIVSQSLHKYGLVYAKDDRFDPQQNDRFLDLMQRYYATRSYQFDKGMKNIDVVVQSQMPIGLKHAYLQKFNTYKEHKNVLRPPHLSLTPDNPQADPTWRFHWIIGSKKNVVPSDFKQFEEVMSTWGNSLKNCGFIIAEMAAVGMNLQKDVFSSKIMKGDLYFSPTGTDLLKSTQNKVLSSFHRDFDLFTIHGKSRYAGLYAWLNTGQKFNVIVPDGHMLIQGGKQLQWLTGGHIKAGFHEVIHNQYVQSAKQDAIRRGKWPWRISSTLFCQAQLSQSLKPLEPFLSAQSLKKYPNITAYEYIQKELAELIHE